MTSVNFSESQLSSALDSAIEASDGVAPELRKNFGKPQEQLAKTNERDFATKWDIWAEEIIIKVLQEFSKDVGILGEEKGKSGNSNTYWTIDPIDGTNSFVRGIETCTTMIALVDEGQPVVGLIHDFNKDVNYTAIIGNGAYKDRDTLQVSNRPLKQARIETWLQEDTERGVNINRNIRKTGATVLRSLSLGYTFALIARGAIEGYLSVDNTYTSSEWDYAPGTLLVQEAGGTVTTVGREKDIFVLGENSMIASNQAVYPDLHNIVRKK